MLRIAWITLRRDRLGLALYAIVPIVFLSIFATVFQGFGRHGENRVRVALLDLDRTAASARLVEAARTGSDRLELESIDTDDPEMMDVLVAGGGFPAGITIPAGFAEALGDPAATIPPLIVRFDPANPIAPEFAQGVLAGAAAIGLAPELLGRQIRVLESVAGPLSDRQRGLLSALDATLDATVDPGLVGDMVAQVAGSGRVPIEASPVELGDGAPSLVTYYTAAIGVMFMLFSALSTTGWLLEEHERGILDRWRASGIGSWSVVLNRFLFAVIVGVVQVAVMLAWAAAVFGVRFFTLRQGVALMILVPAIAAAAAALGMFITGLARTRRQQTTIGTITVLVLSAVGGSMIPSFMMPPSLQAVGEWAFNARAIAAMQQILWYTSPGDTVVSMLGRIAPALLLIVGTAATLLIGARMLVGRWR